MPEYLSPGVFIEEVPPRLRAIEGVSTSTAGFVGPAERGPVPGYPLPFTPPVGFVVPLDPSPVLVTSFGEFTRQFGSPLPLPDPDNNAYLAYAVRAFFDNGGRRAYIARVAHFTDPLDNSSALRSNALLAQGVVLRLQRSARANEDRIYLTSLRGVDKNVTLNFRKRSDGSDAISSPAKITGKPAPYAFHDGDAFSVNVSGDQVDMTTPIKATPATAISGAAPFALADGQTLQIRVGPASEPVQTVTFKSGDFIDPPGDIAHATADQVTTVLNRDLTGVQVLVEGGRVRIRTDQSGTGAQLAILDGPAAGTLNFVPTPSSGNVVDVARVTIDEIAARFSTTKFSIRDNGTGKLQIASTGVGSGATLQLVDTVPGTAAKLGLEGFLSPPPVQGSGSVRSVNSYDPKSGLVVLDGPLGTDIDPVSVYITVSGVSLNKGPTFWARSPGKWGDSVSVLISNSDRSPVPITAPAAGSATSVQVQNTSSFYKGAIVEIDHGTSHSYYECVDIAGNAITLDPALKSAVTTSSFARVMEIDVTVADESGVAALESYRGLSWNRTGSAKDLRRHYATTINARSRLVYVQPPGGGEDPNLESQPMTPNGFPLKLSSGSDGGTAQDPDYIGIDNGPGLRTGIQSLKDIDDIRIIAAPGRKEAAVQNELITQCELLRYRFAVLDGEQDPTGGSVTAILAHRSTYDTSYAAYYTPWVGVTVGDNTLYLPPSGYMAGLYARVDNARGVWKAPANEVVQNITGLKINFTTGEQDILNPRGVNAIRRFEGQGIRAWGARTLSSDPSVKYINVRRFLIFLEASIFRGTQWAVFEPNTPDTWGRVQDSVGAFLNTQWREGALFGRRPEDAYFVRCDETTMTADDVQNGRLICLIGVAIVRPAEFVIFRIEQITGFANK
ncbi:MAG TPA: phage tail sheath subtilisin-like domain-containing protein [Polyangia bacterium]|jgi:phage tail sheath protein FI|nr:phage tail sheath subtilisin-like domain-containing protein [Polyangia bacterium]